MATAEEAQRAISELNGKDLDGRKITVNVSNPRTPGSGGGRGPGGPRGGGRGPGGPRGGGGDRGAYGVPPSKTPFRWLYDPGTDSTTGAAIIAAPFLFPPLRRGNPRRRVRRGPSRPPPARISARTGRSRGPRP
jgi:RNA recognition motif-containing protein